MDFRIVAAGLRRTYNNTSNIHGVNTMSISERKKEIKRRRKRREQYAKMLAKIEKADTRTRNKFAEKLRGMTPAAETLIERWGLK
ncbi:MAG: hypothetical protein LBU65_09055 [Planctomycetaceae bacterium]|jgi:hypothetical protein|nr:hypothetical protein [Planctomycetaceae bacterium]